MLPGPRPSLSGGLLGREDGRWHCQVFSVQKGGGQKAREAATLPVGRPTKCCDRRGGPPPQPSRCSRESDLPASPSFEVRSAIIACPSPHAFVTAGRPFGDCCVRGFRLLGGEGGRGVCQVFSGQRRGGSSGSSSDRQRLTRGQSPLGSRGGTCQVARLRGGRAPVKQGVELDRGLVWAASGLKKLDEPRGHPLQLAREA